VTRSLATKAEDWVRQRTGHRSNELLRYREAARSLAELELGDVLPLVDAIPELTRGGPILDQSGTGFSPELETDLQGVGHGVGQAPSDHRSHVGPFPNNPNGVHEEGLEPAAEAAGRSEGRRPTRARGNRVHEEGLEPTHLAVPEPKSGASASSATRARKRA
jgi:hypothetical protein